VQLLPNSSPSSSNGPNDAVQLSSSNSGTSVDLKRNEPVDSSVDEEPVVRVSKSAAKRRRRLKKNSVFYDELPSEEDEEAPARSESSSSASRPTGPAYDGNGDMASTKPTLGRVARGSHIFSVCTTHGVWLFSDARNEAKRKAERTGSALVTPAAAQMASTMDTPALVAKLADTQKKLEELRRRKAQGSKADTEVVSMDLDEADASGR
jgi:hypothetical protein